MSKILKNLQNFDKMAQSPRKIFKIFKNIQNFDKIAQNLRKIFRNLKKKQRRPFFRTVQTSVQNWTP